MGFKDFNIMNQALLAKQAWRLVNNPNSLWAQILKGKYFVGESLWKVKKKAGSSWVWESLLEGRDLLLNHGQWQIGDGKSVRIYKDKWIDKVLISCDHSDLDMDLTVSNLLNQQQRSWDIQKILNTFSRNIAAKIIALPLLPGSDPDRLIWPYTKNGDYAIKSG